MVKTVTHTKAPSFEIPKLKDLEKPQKFPEVTRICDPSKSRARRHQFQSWFEIEVSQLRSATPIVK